MNFELDRVYAIMILIQPENERCKMTYCVRREQAVKLGLNGVYRIGIAFGSRFESWNVRQKCSFLAGLSFRPLGQALGPDR